MKSRLEMIARQQGYSLLFLHSTINTWLIYVKLQQLILSPSLPQSSTRMGFHITEATCYLTADLFYLEVALLPCGSAEDVKVARHGGSPLVRATRALTPKPHFVCVITKLLTVLQPSKSFLQLLRSGVRMLSWPHTVSHFTIASRVAVLKPCFFFTQSETLWGVLQKVGSAIYPVQHPRGQVPTLLFYY